MCTMSRRLAKQPAVETAASDHLTGKRTWLTEDGPVVIDVQGDTVMVTESLDQDTTDKLEQEIFGMAAAAK